MKFFVAIMVIFCGLSAFADQVYVGIGVTITQIKKDVVVAEVAVGGPADLAGVRADDIITAIDAASVVGKSLDDVAKAIIGPEGSSVSITVKTAGVERTVKMIRSKIIVHCFIEGSVSLTTNATLTTPATSVQGYVGTQYLFGQVSGGFINGQLGGEQVSLNYRYLNSQETISGYVHGATVQWFGTNGHLSGYQSCIP